VKKLNFSPVLTGEKEANLRAEVRSFLKNYGAFNVSNIIDSWSICDPELSRALAAKGWLGMTWPTEYGGGGRSYLERYVVIEELLAACWSTLGGRSSKWSSFITFWNRRATPTFLA